MSDSPIDCGHAEELLPDDVDGVLAVPLREDLERHLVSCQDCRELRGALADVVTALRHARVPEPSATLAARAAQAAIAAPSNRGQAPSNRGQAGGPRRWSPFPLRIPFQAVAAVLALAVTTLVLWIARDPARAGNLLVARTLSSGEYLMERKDRLVEDMRILIAVVGTAFEGRIESVGSRVEDYRRLIEERRRGQPSPRPAAPPSAPPGTSGTTLSNPEATRFVSRSKTAPRGA